ncbi:MAG: hypothetical protein II330_07445, partial [Clostridia bacterium]|nr:hypothetical protein [Clostridia bacterium]
LAVFAKSRQFLLEIHLPDFYAYSPSSHCASLREPSFPRGDGFLRASVPFSCLLWVFLHLMTLEQVPALRYAIIIAHLIRACKREQGFLLDKEQGFLLDKEAYLL